MCELSGKLVACLDRELEKDEMDYVQRHIQDCAECRRQFDTYKEVSRTFDTCRHAVMASRRRPRQSHWVPVLSVAATVVFAAAAFFGFWHTHAEPPVPPPTMKTVLSPPILGTGSTPSSTVQVHRRRKPSPEQIQIAKWRPAEPAIHIAIPAESVFPPGAIPEGVSFTADLSIATDGSAQQIRLTPRLIGFERRIQP